MSVTSLVIIFAVIQSLLTAFYGFTIYPVEYKDKGDVSNFFLLISFLIDIVFSVIIYYGFNQLKIEHHFTQIWFFCAFLFRIFLFLKKKEENTFIIDTILILINTLTYYEMLLTI